MRPRKTVSAEASPHDKRARSASQEYVTPEDRASQKRKQPDMTPKKVWKLPRPQVHHSEELAWPEKHPEPQKQSREARTSSSSSRGPKARTSSSSSRGRKARTSSSSSSRGWKARTSSTSSRSHSPKAKQQPAFLDSEHHRIRCFELFGSFLSQHVVQCLTRSRHLVPSPCSFLFFCISRTKFFAAVVFQFSFQSFQLSVKTFQNVKTCVY